MSAIRIRTFENLAAKVPPGLHIEVWSDSAVWLYDDEGHRIRLREFIEAVYPSPEDWPPEMPRSEVHIDVHGSDERAAGYSVGFDAGFDAGMRRRG